MWYQIDGCVKQYRYVMAYHLMYSLLKSYTSFIDRGVGTSGHGKYVVYGFNVVQKPYFATCLIMCSMPEVDDIDRIAPIDRW